MPLSLALCLLFLSQAPAYELSGYIEAEGRAFFNDALFPGQERDSASLAIQPEFYHEWGKGSNLTFTPFARIDSADPARSHFDIRELNYLLFNDKWELRIGISKVFWGVTEFVHLIDIINQTDLVEDMDGEDKLGQPMILFSAPRNWGTVNIFILPYFRERTFPGEKGRFRSEFTVDTDNAVYESPAKEHHIDLAVRYSHTIGDWDFGIYHFNGTGREPIIYLDTDADGNPGLVPFYEQIDQTGLDVQAVKGSWLIKLESLYRTGQGEGFFAGVGGIEYSFVNIASSRMDLGLIGEWAYDERGDEATTMFDNDIMAGARLAFNDAASTEALIGLIQDLNSEGTVLSLESGRRIGNSWKINLDSFFVLDSSEEDAVHSLRNDDSVQLEIAYFF
ncbi:MAG: hypothetical protein KAJ10_08835 [Thermodesulfovibrionia bacterium]|nr:hypothetical protein [Thermodesulfovibrionia bacterium]